MDEELKKKLERYNREAMTPFMKRLSFYMPIGCLIGDKKMVNIQLAVSKSQIPSDVYKIFKSWADDMPEQRGS